MIDFEKAQEIVNRELASLVFKREPSELYDPVEYILSIGGKRIRPAMVLMACSLFSDKISHAVRCALAIEVFHNFTLLHDDIMDNSALRRNKPTVHEKWNRNVAILSGDVMSILSYRLIGECPQEFLPDVLALFTDTALKVCEGQQYDMNFETRNDISVNDYIKMITLKTSVLIAASLKLGAMLGGALPADSDLMYEFGKNIGIAFQLRDDILDVYGDTKKFGKKTGTDIVANKKTYLLLKALELADEPSRKRLVTLMSENQGDNEKKIAEVMHLFDMLGVRDKAEKKSWEFYNTGIKAFNLVSVEDFRKKALHDLARKLMEREK
jgi:geranylgeranyl diphosphate synthase, type II